jgi:hypothetical protein
MLRWRPIGWLDKIRKEIFNLEISVPVQPGINFQIIDIPTSGF